MTKSTKRSQNAHFAGQAQEYKSLLDSIKKQQADLMAEQRLFKTECLRLARSAYVTNGGELEVGEDLPKLIALLESL